MKVISIINQKGGVGKTATTLALAYGLALKGNKTLLVDFDPQGLATINAGVSVDVENPASYKLLGIQSKSILEIQHIRENLDICASSFGLEKANIMLSTKNFRENYLKNALYNIDHINKYKYIIIDTHPSLNLLTMNALMASDELIIPYKPEADSIQALDVLISNIKEIKRINKKIKISGFLTTLADERRYSTSQVIEYVMNLAKENKTKVFSLCIPISVYVADCGNNNKSIYEYKKASKPAAAYMSFVEEFLKDQEK